MNSREDNPSDLTIHTVECHVALEAIACHQHSSLASIHANDDHVLSVGIKVLDPLVFFVG